MYKIEELNGEVLTLDNEGFNDYLVESLRHVGANNDEIDEVKEGIRQTKDSCKCNIEFDGRDLFSVYIIMEKDDINEFCELAVVVNGVVTCESCEACEHYESYEKGFYFDCDLIN